MNASGEDIVLWLQARPFQDNPGMTGSPVLETFDSWEEWVKRGAHIPEVEKRLTLVLEHDKDPVNRGAAALALGFVGSDASLQPLIQALKSDLPMVGIEAAAALGRLGKSEAVDALCEALRSPDPNVRANALLALGQLGGEKAFACLRHVPEVENDPFVLGAAKEALRKNPST